MKGMREGRRNKNCFKGDVNILKVQWKIYENLLVSKEKFREGVRWSVENMKILDFNKSTGSLVFLNA